MSQEPDRAPAVTGKREELTGKIIADILDGFVESAAMIAGKFDIPLGVARQILSSEEVKTVISDTLRESLKQEFRMVVPAKLMQIVKGSDKNSEINAAAQTLARILGEEPTKQMVHNQNLHVSFFDETIRKLTKLGPQPGDEEGEFDASWPGARALTQKIKE